MMNFEKDEYSSWLMGYKSAEVDSPTGYLRKLQELHRIPYHGSKQEQLSINEFSKLRRKQLSNLPGISETEDEDRNDKHDVCAEQTFYFQKIWGEILPCLPAEVADVVQGVQIGVLPSRTVNAGVMLTPYGTPIIIVDSGLLAMISFFTEVNAIGSLIIKDEDERSNYLAWHYRWILEYYENRGEMSFPKPRPEHKLELHHAWMLQMQNICCEIFLICHEIAHIYLGHLDDSSASKLMMPSSSVRSQENESEAQVYNHSQHEEFLADIVGYEIYMNILPRHPSLGKVDSGTQLPRTECLMIFHLMHLVENNSRKFRDITSHPSAKDRISAIFSSRFEKIQRETGKSDEEMRGNPLLDAIYGHYQMLINARKI